MFFKNLFLTATEAVDAVTEAIGEIAGEVVTVEAAADSLFKFYPQGFVEQLGHMGIGMLAIFVVIAAIIGVVYALDILVKAFSIKLPKNQ